MNEEPQRTQNPMMVNSSELFNYLLVQEQNNVLEAIRNLEFRNERGLDPRSSQAQLKVALKILILRMDPYLKNGKVTRESLDYRMRSSSDDELMKVYHDLSEIINMNMNRKVIL